MATYAELQDQVAGIIIDTPTVVLNQIPQFIKEAVREVQTKHNFRVMQAVSSVYTTTAETTLLATVPTDFKEYRGRPYLINASGGTSPLSVVQDAQQAVQAYGTDAGGEADTDTLVGRPRAITQLPTDNLGGAAFHVWPLPDELSLYDNGNYRIVIPYWKYLPALSSGADTNWFTLNAEEWIKYKAAATAFWADHDEERGTFWEQRAAKQFKDIIIRDKYAALAGFNTLVPRFDVYESTVEPGPVNEMAWNRTL